MIPVIIVDDELYVRVSLKSRVDWASAGAVVVGEAAGGLQALELIGELRPLLVITDIKMPGMDGMELIRRAKERSPDLRFVILSGYSDFAYARQAIHLGVSDFIEKPVNGAELTETVRVLARKLEMENAEKRRYEQILRSHEVAGRLHRTSLWNRALQGTARGEEGLDASFSHSWYSLAVLQVADPAGPDLTGLFPEGVLPPGCELFPLEVCGGMYGLVRMASTADGCDLRPDAGRLRYLLGLPKTMREKTPVYITCTAPVEGWRELAGSFREAVLALKSKLFRPARLDCHPDGERDERPAIGTEIRDRVRGLRRLLASLKEGDFCRELQRLLFGEGLSVPVLEWVLVELCAELGSLLPGNRPEECAVFLEELSGRDVLLRFYSREELYDYLCEGAAAVMHAVRMEEPDGADIVEQVLEYIDKNCAANLSLAHMGGEFYVSPVYLSAVFKRKTGQNLSQYIENLRIERAKRLLAESDLPMNEITLSVGYGDSNYFGKVFRKKTGQSPSDYRKKYGDHIPV